MHDPDHAARFARDCVARPWTPYNLARWLARDPGLADDIVQDAMLRAMTYFASFRGENPRAWLLQIVRNVALDMLRSRDVRHRNWKSRLNGTGTTTRRISIRPTRAADRK